MHIFFVSDLHGHIPRYHKLFKSIEEDLPEAVLLGGDLMPSGLKSLVSSSDQQIRFITDFLFVELDRLRKKLKDRYPRIFLILGNDDSKADEKEILQGQDSALWEYISERTVSLGNFQISGYPYVPPTPFLLKDFEKYDVSQFVDPGCIPIEDGFFSTQINKSLIKRDTIKNDLDRLAEHIDPERSILLFHTPPYQTKLDRADLDNKFYEHVPLDVHIGSIALRRFIEDLQPRITLHGHVHESSRLTGHWSDRIGTTYMYSAAIEENDLALICFDPEYPALAQRKII